MNRTATSEISAARAMWLLTQLRLNRLLNQFSVIYNRKLSFGKSRPATQSKKRGSWVYALILGIGMSFSFINLSGNSIINLHCNIDTSSRCYVGDGPVQFRGNDRHAAAEIQRTAFSPALTNGITLVMTILFIGSILMPLGARELSQSDWDMEWLTTLPTSRTVLILGRLLERSIANPFGVFALGPFSLMVAWYSGYRWGAPVLGLCATFILLVLAALFRTLVDTGLRLSLQPSRLRNLQACVSVLSVVFMYIAFSFGTPMLSFTFEWARAFPRWAVWTPPGLVVQALNASSLGSMVTLGFLLILESAACVIAGIAVLSYQLRHGVVATSSRESGRRQAARPAHTTGRSSLISTIKRRELRLLSRDRNFLIQTLVLPVLVVVGQMILNGSLTSVSDIGASPRFMATLAFGISAYVLMLSAFQTLISEGGALWLLYTFPRSIEGVLKEKAQMWALLALIYPIAVFALGIGLSHRISWELIAMMLQVLVGIPIFSVIAVSLGVFACNPLAQEVQSKIRISYTYLYMLLSGAYGYSIYSGIWLQNLVLIVLLGALAASLWQKAREELPYLLDPTASPAEHVSMADGMIAAIFFFVLQGIVALVLIGNAQQVSVFNIVIAYSVGGALTYGIFRLKYWWSGTIGVPEIIGPEINASLHWGVGIGVIAAVFGTAYLLLLRCFGVRPEFDLIQMHGTNVAWLIILAVIAAPIFEEFIFRGLIFGGMRRLAPTNLAIIASAAIFAIVHPALSMVPVFFVGICTAYTYERTETLLAPMLVHAIYNAVIVGIQLMWV